MVGNPWPSPFPQTTDYLLNVKVFGKEIYLLTNKGLYEGDFSGTWKKIWTNPSPNDTLAPKRSFIGKAGDAVYFGKLAVRSRSPWTAVQAGARSLGFPVV